METTLVLLLLLMVAVWLWSDGLRARELALAAGARACRELDVQHLDQTVVLRRLALGRTRSGRVAILRAFGFEFTTDGVGRRQGLVVVVGRHVDSLQMDLPEGRTILDAAGRPLGTLQ